VVRGPLFGLLLSLHVVNVYPLPEVFNTIFATKLSLIFHGFI
jgi:hypothetical protein